MAGRQDIPILEDKIASLNKKIEETLQHARGTLQFGKQRREAITPYFNQLLSANLAATQERLVEQSIEQYFDWNAPEWGTWKPVVFSPDNLDETTRPPTMLRIGDLLENRSQGQFTVPAMIPFIGSNRTIIIKTDPDDHQRGLALLQSLIVRIALMLPYQAVFTLLDPANAGAAYPMRRQLSEKENSGDVRRDLEAVLQDITRINSSIMDVNYASFEQLPAAIRINERFHFIFAADFPNGYNRQAVELLHSVAKNGPRTGKYVFVHYNTAHPVHKDTPMEKFENAYYIELSKSVSYNGLSLNLRPEGAPKAERQNALFEELKKAKPPERKVDWETVIGISQGNRWEGVSDTLITTPIGIAGASGQLNLWFGMNSEGHPVAHGMLGAMTGAGKSNLYHVLILGLAVRYSPKELRLFLIDGKDGVEFQAYRRLPHAEVVSLKSSPQLSRSVLQELVAERERRNRIFTEVGVQDITGYRRAGQPNGFLPRILLLIDEYQQLFEGDSDNMGSTLLRQIAEQGRSAGIHMLLGSQRFGAANMVGQQAIFGNIHLRMAMQMTASDVQALTEFDREGKSLIATCDLPGKIVVNDHSGSNGANAAGKVAFLTDEKRREVVEELIHLADSTLSPKENPVTIVFDGKAQPNFIENHHVEYLLQSECWLSADEFKAFAIRPVHDEGLDVVDWFHAERPHVAWLGQDFSVRGNANIIFRRRLAEHALIIGGTNPVRFGMMGSIVASLVLNSSPKSAAFTILDRSIPGTVWNETLRRIKETVLDPAGYKVEFYKENRDVERLLDNLLEEIKRRQEIDEEYRIQEPSMFVLMADLERVDELRRRADTYGMGESPLGDRLQRIILEGPQQGIHLIMTFGGVRPMTNIIDERRVLVNFRHRVALQMAEEESLTLVRSRKAAQLQSDGPTPIVGLYLDVENDRTLRFKPYSIESSTPEMDYYVQMEKIGTWLADWSDQL